MKPNVFYTPSDYSKFRLPKIRRALIIHPGALGDCILTLRLAEFLKQKLRINFLEFAGNMDHIKFFVGRTCVDKVTSFEKLETSRLFTEPADFTVEENDRLISNFAGYDWVLSFLGDKNGSFEQNLIYILYHTNSPEVVTLSAKAPQSYKGHICQFHVDELVEEKRAAIETYSELDDWKINLKQAVISPSSEDRTAAIELLKAAGHIKSFNDNLAVIAPGSGSKHKNWYLNNFIDLAEKMVQSNYKTVYLLGPAELERLTQNEINILMNTAHVVAPENTDQLCALLSIANVYIGNDSGPAHMSAGLGTKTFAIFGASSIDRYHPTGPYAFSINESEKSFNENDPDSVSRVFDFIKRRIKNNYPHWDVMI